MSKTIITLAVALIFAATATASSLDMTITDSTGDFTGNEVTFVQETGVHCELATFDLAVSVDPSPDAYFKGLSLFLTMSEDIGAEIFARDIHGVDWEWGPYVVDPTTADSTLFTCKACPHRRLNPSTGDLGATTKDPAYGDPAGQLMTLQILIPIYYYTPLGQYTIVATGSTYVQEDNSCGEFDTMSSFVVNIVPEPVTLTLLTLGGIALIRRR